MNRPNSIKRPSISSFECEEGKEKEYLLQINDMALSGNGDACALMGSILMSERSLEQFALDYLLIGYKANHLECKYLLANYCRDHGRDEEEIAIRKELLYQNFAPGASKLIKLLWLLDRDDEAFVCLKQWESFDHDYPGLIELLGAHYWRVGDYENAFNVYQRNEKFFSYELGYFYLHGLGVEKDIRKALIYFRKDVKQSRPFSSYTWTEDSEIKLAMCYFYGYGVDKDVDKADLFINRFFLVHHRRYGNVVKESREFIDNCGFKERMHVRIQSLMEEGKRNPSKYMDAYYLHLRYPQEFQQEISSCLKEASKIGVKGATCLLAYDRELCQGDARKLYLNKARRDGYRDISSALEELPFPKDRAKFLSSLKDDNWKIYLQDILYWMAKDKNGPLFAKAVAMANEVPIETFLFYEFGPSRFCFPYELLKKEEATKFYKRLLLTDYYRFHDEKIDEAYEIDPEKVLCEDLFGKGEE